MAIDYLSYTRRGFLPAPKDKDDSFKTRSDMTIDYSERIRSMAANGDERLENLISGTADLFNLNPFHELACKDIHIKLGMYPCHFVGFHTDIKSNEKKHDLQEARRPARSMRFNELQRIRGAILCYR